jgi:23S rRNA (pseudouridine1915-N3)-methyltransferase
MSRQIIVLWAGRHRRDRWQELVDDYSGRIRRFIEIEDRALRVPRRGDEEGRRRLEAEKILASMPSDAWSIALDEGGRSHGSEGLARHVGKLIDAWAGPLVFVVGSDVGLDRSLVGECRETLSLGPLTLPHELARLLLYEQLYRCLAIRGGINYHRGRLSGS